MDLSSWLHLEYRTAEFIDLCLLAEKIQVALVSMAGTEVSAGSDIGQENRRLRRMVDTFERLINTTGPFPVLITTNVICDNHPNSRNLLTTQRLVFKSKSIVT